MRGLYYRLDGHEVVETDRRTAFSDEEWGDKRHVAYDTVGDVRVSTVFLPVDHGWGDGPPLVFETMTFGEPHDQLCWRYSTWTQAEEGHRAIVAALREGRELPE